MKYSLIGSALIACLTLLACKASKTVAFQPAAGSEALYQSKWNLSELNGAPVASNKTPFLAFLPGQVNVVSGNTGCNTLRGEFVLSENSQINFSKMIITRMACIGESVEAPLVALLNSPLTWSITNNELTLSNSKGEKAKFTAVAAGTVTEALTGDWELSYISGPKIAFDALYPGKKPNILFKISDTEVGGFTGCNGFSAKVNIDSNKIKFGDPLSTMMACQGAGESSFVKALKEVNRYEVINNSELVLYAESIPLMRFKKRQQ